MGSIRGRLTPQARPASESDIHAITAINVSLHLWHQDRYPHHFKPLPDRDVAAAYFHDQLHASDTYIRVATVDAVVAGYVLATTETKPDTPFTSAMRTLHIHHIAVAPDMQRNGIGRILLEDAHQLARAAGCTVVTLDSWSANHAAHTAFASSGFSEMRRWFLKMV